MQGVHHAAICIADVGRSLRFWRDGLGLTVPMAVIAGSDGALVELIGPAA